MINAITMRKEQSAVNSGYQAQIKKNNTSFKGILPVKKPATNDAAELLKRLEEAKWGGWMLAAGGTGFLTFLKDIFSPDSPLAILGALASIGSIIIAALGARQLYSNTPPFKVAK